MSPLAQLRYLHRVWKARRRGERPEMEALLRIVRPGDTVLDIGANKGSYLYWLRRATGPSGRVVAFEPQPILAAYLRDVVLARHWSNVVIEGKGLSERAGTLLLGVPAGGDGTSPGASFEASIAGNPGSHSVPVEVETLDGLFAGGPRVAFIKCDVEGHELSVFRGGERLLRESGPTLLFECEARHLGGREMREVFAWLEDRGYAGEFFGPAGLRPIREFSPDIHQRAVGPRFWDAPGYCNNFLFQRTQ
ncbi:MAG: FkbM family methyltransferase [Verrucomicrobia bacterium]|nr:MAG: FkbM family methyltransferase [Verrucomicrobiota bacterium]